MLNNPFFPVALAAIGLALGLLALWRGRGKHALASTDSLTGLNNRRCFDVDVDDRQRRGDGPTAMLMIDVDHFKSFNDTHGHSVGDDVLRRVSDSIRAQIRRNDVAYRYGGEEFAVLLPNAGEEVAAAVAERIRAATAAAELPVRGRVTVSVGVATGPSDAINATIDDADAALYRAKDAGRNRVAVASAS